MTTRWLLVLAVIGAGCLHSEIARQARAECQEADASGIYALWAGTNRIEIEVQDDDVNLGNPNIDGDGLPERYRCVGDVNWIPLNPGLNDALANCGNVDFDIWVGTANADADPVAIIDSATPTALFGGDGDETITGTQEGDFIHGGAGRDHLNGGEGPDRLCPGPGTNLPQFVRGEGGPDFLQGGPDRDHLWGGAARDLLQGALLDDRLEGGAGNDVLLGGPHDDTIDGGPGHDVLHGGKGDDAMDGGTGEDLLAAQDVFGDALIDGGSVGPDVCYVDAVGDLGVNCAAAQMVACSREMWVGTRFSGEAYLNRLDPDNGSRLTAVSRGVQIGLGVMGVAAEKITALAVSPTDCTLWSILEAGSTQYLATINTTPGVKIGYIATEVTSSATSTFVDLAFDSRGHLYLLDGDGDLEEWDLVNGGLTTRVSDIGRGGQSALRMAWDDPDAGWLFVITTDGAPAPTYYVDVVHPAVNGSAWAASSTDADYSITVNHSFGSSGQFQEIDDNHDMWHRRRRKWERVEQMCGLTQCSAQVAGTIDAIAVPHWW